MKEDNGVTITLTSDEVEALGVAVELYLEHCLKMGFNEQREKTARSLHSYVRKMLPHIQRKFKEGAE